MTRADELRALAARVETAQGADRELDGEISRAIGTPGWRLSEAGRWFQSNLRRAEFAPTASLDAAASLASGYLWTLDRIEDQSLAYVMRSRGQPRFQCWAATPALALTAAALRALAEEAGDG